MNAIVQVAMVLISVTLSAFGSAITAKSVSNGSQFLFDGSSSGYIITAGGCTNDWVTNTYILNLNSGEWTALPPLPIKSSDIYPILRDSTIYAVGGYSEGWSRTTLIFSTKDNMWKTSSDLIFDYGPVLSASVNESIYAVGGIANGHTLQVMGCSGEWNTLASSIYSHRSDWDSAAVLNNKIYVLGCHHTDEVYDISTNSWTAFRMSNQDRINAGIVALNGYIYVIGGANAKNERYDPTTGELTYFQACLYTPVSQAAVVTDGKMIYVIAGWIDGAVTNKVQVYRPDQDLWQSLSEYPISANFVGGLYITNF